MVAQYELDEFDRVAPHGGRHRIRRTGFVRVREWLLVFSITVVVTGMGFYGFKYFGDANIFNNFAPIETATETQVSGSLGPGVTVIDASNRDKIATDAATKLAANGFNVLAARNLDSLVNPAGYGASVVYAKTSAAMATAGQVATKLGGLKVVTEDKFDDPVTVVLGSNYKG